MIKWSEHKGARLGKICKRGHDHGGGSWRLPNYSCAECAYLKAREYLAKNQARYNDHARKWRAENKIAALVHNIRSLHKSNITIDDLKPFPARCPLLGTKLEYNGAPVDRAVRPSIDKIIPSKGYVKGNVHIVSFRANTIKNDASYEELALIAKNLKKIVERKR